MKSSRTSRYLPLLMAIAAAGFMLQAGLLLNAAASSEDARVLAGFGAAATSAILLLGSHLATQRLGGRRKSR